MPFLVPVIGAIGSGLAAIGGGSALAGGALVASTAAGVYGASKTASAIKSAANTQAASADAGIAEQQRQFNVTQQNLQPWLHGGQAALNQQLQLLGLGGLSGLGGNTGSSPVVGGYNVDKLLADNPDVAQWANSGHGDPNTPIDQQSMADRVNYWIQNGISLNDPRAINAPKYTDADVAAAGPAAQQQTAITQLQNSPLYQSLYRNGVNTILANGSATGGLRGGNIQSSLANFGSDTLASVIQNQLANLGSISNTGNNTGTNLGQLGSTNSSQIAQLLGQQGSARAGGILGAANAGNQGLSALLNGIGRGVSGLQQYGGLTSYLQGGAAANPNLF